jgi:ATP-dependent Clp protease adaptor protein ClpS
VTTERAGETERNAEESGATATLVRPDDPWVTIVWNDPVNLMSYVAYVFESYFGYTQTKAEQLMLEVHHDGRSVVSAGSREQMERDVQAMHERGLWATFERSGR